MSRTKSSKQSSLEKMLEADILSVQTTSPFFFVDGGPSQCKNNTVYLFNTDGLTVCLDFLLLDLFYMFFSKDNFMRYGFFFSSFMLLLWGQVYFISSIFLWHDSPKLISL